LRHFTPGIALVQNLARRLRAFASANARPAQPRPSKQERQKQDSADENGNGATVTIADVEQSNGVIHVIDKVLLPKL
jgi:uncharacterized surface protein with fasciclin (FAS1) repeats